MSRRSTDKFRQQQKKIETGPPGPAADPQPALEPLPLPGLRGAWQFHRVPLAIAAALTALLYLFLFLWVKV